MSIIKAWGDSLQIFVPHNFKLFCLVTLKTIMRVYTILFQQFWWLVLAGGLLSAVAPTVSLYVVRPIIILLFYLIARPSVQPKGYWYLKDHVKHVLWLLPLFMLDPLFKTFDLFYYVVAFSIIKIFFVLFVLDSYARPKDIILSAVRAVKMAVYNAPFYVIGLGWFYLVYASLKSILVMYPHYTFLTLYVGWLLFPISLCFFVNFYIKKVHEQFVLYFD